MRLIDYLPKYFIKKDKTEFGFTEYKLCEIDGKYAETLFVNDDSGCFYESFSERVENVIFDCENITAITKYEWHVMMGKIMDYKSYEFIEIFNQIYGRDDT